jgi:hypothetical protein
MAPHDGWGSVPAVALKEALGGGPPAQQTWVQTAWTNTSFLVRFDVDDRDVRATLTERDAPLYIEEVVEVFLDPVGDLECYFELELNPLNAVLDLALRRTRSGYRKDVCWRCDELQTETALREGGWTARFTIPFASITPGKPAAGTVWRGNFFRIDRPSNQPRELSAWSPPRRGTFHTPEKFGRIIFA